MSSRHISPTTRRRARRIRVAGRPVYQTGGFGELVDLALGILAASAGWAAAACRRWCRRREACASRGRRDQDSDQAAKDIEKDMAGPGLIWIVLFRDDTSRYLYTEWVRFAAHAARTCGM
jgi:hypothetical protein